MRPFLTVIVPVRNEERYIERCLYSIASQDYPRERIEVIVADGRSTDRTRETVARFGAESTLEVLLIDNSGVLPAPGMNAGLRHARGSLVVRLDGHAALEPEYLRLCADAVDGAGAACAGGVLISEGDTYVGRAIALAMSSRFGVGGAAFRVGGSGPVDTVAFGVYRREVFDAIGLYAEDIPAGEDDEFNYRLRDVGGLILLVPEARARYVVRGGLRALWRQYFGYGRAKPEVLRRHPAQARTRQLIPVALVSAFGGAAAMAVAGQPRPLANLTLLYAVYVAAASAAIAVGRRSLRSLPVLPPALACLHFAYGSGFVAGAAALAVRRIIGRREPASSRQGATSA